MAQRIYDYLNDGSVIEVTDPDEIALVSLKQQLLLGLGESPFYSDHGIPFEFASMMSQPPDAYIEQIRQRNLQNFATLHITRDLSQQEPVYSVIAVLKNGTLKNVTVAR